MISFILNWSPSSFSLIKKDTYFLLKTFDFQWTTYSPIIKKEERICQVRLDHVATNLPHKKIYHISSYPYITIYVYILQIQYMKHSPPKLNYLLIQINIISTIQIDDKLFILCGSRLPTSIDPQPSPQYRTLLSIPKSVLPRNLYKITNVYVTFTPVSSPYH